ncbi:hypothetical protein RYX36_030970 [Vicia faba]
MQQTLDLKKRDASFRQKDFKNAIDCYIQDNTEGLVLLIDAIEKADHTRKGIIKAEHEQDASNVGD